MPHEPTDDKLAAKAQPTAQGANESHTSEDRRAALARVVQILQDSQRRRRQAIGQNN